MRKIMKTLKAIKENTDQIKITEKNGQERERLKITEQDNKDEYQKQH